MQVEVLLQTEKGRVKIDTLMRYCTLMSRTQACSFYVVENSRSTQESMMVAKRISSHLAP